MDLSSLSSYFDVEKITDTFNKVKNAVLQLTEYQVKVLDATNNDPWGASSTLMTEIANATNNYQYFSEIMDTLYKRLQESPGPYWRQPYKALQLLEYLIKNGSERVVDYARERIYEVKAMRNFHYIDEKGKDQGINIRQRAKEIVDLLGDTEKIRLSRIKAKENRAKYTGVAGGSGSSGRYGGFGSDAGGYGGSYGGSSYGGGYGDSSTNGGFQDDSSDYRSPPRSPIREPDVPTTTSHTPQSKINIKIKSEGQSAVASSATAAAKGTGGTNLLDVDGDDWGEFTSAPTTTQAAPASAPSSGFADFSSFQSAPAAAPAPFAAFGSTTPSGINQAPGFGAASPLAKGPSSGLPPVMFTPTQTLSTPPPKPSGMGDLFGDFNNLKISSAAATPTGSASSFGNKKGNDPFASLVSLDPSALAGPGKKQETTGPSLSAMATTMSPGILQPMRPSQTSPAAAQSTKRSTQNSLQDLLF
ncbi:hypothetical protein DFJ73DRAFT_840420 [Zopfochytrium polystomum]|nr:hypothetical protein DFJ73DRAFT_840420 [Zopfochytrium polystomum]